MSAVLLIALIGGVLGDVPLTPLLAEIFPRRLASGRLARGLGIFSRAFGTAVLFWNRRQFAHGDTPFAAGPPFNARRPGHVPCPSNRPMKLTRAPAAPLLQGAPGGQNGCGGTHFGAIRP